MQKMHLKILKDNDIKYSENRNGIFVNMNVFDEIVDEGDVDEKEYLAKNLVDLGKGRRQTQFYYSLLKIQERREKYHKELSEINGIGEDEEDLKELNLYI